MRKRLMLGALAALAVVLAACAPGATSSGGSTAVSLPNQCVSETTPRVAVIDFENTTSNSGQTVLGLENAATARVITHLQQSGCYTVLERSELQTILERQGMESLDPVEIARFAGAGYVITGTVTRATISQPSGSILGISLGATSAQVEVDLRATDINTGEVIVSRTGSGSASNPNIAFSNRDLGYISYNDSEYGPLIAEAANAAVDDVVRAVRLRF